MNSEILSRLYPFNRLSRQALESIDTYADVRLFHDEDYVFRLGEPLKDLYYVLDGVVQIMDIENRTNETLRHDSEQAIQPFTHNVPASAVAVAKPGTRILMVSFEQLWKVLPQERDRLLRIRPGRLAEPEPVKRATVQGSEPEYLELPTEMDENIRLINSQAQNRIKPKSPVKPHAATGAATKPAKSRQHKQHQPSSPKRAPVLQQQTRAVTKKTEQPSQRNRVTEIMSGLKDFLSSDITLEPASRATKSAEPEASKPSSKPSAAQKARVTSVAQLLSGAKEILYSEIKLQPRSRKEEESVESGADQNTDKKVLSEAEYREVEMQEYMRAMSLYRQQKWDSAHAAFKALYTANPRTNLYREYVNRCEEHLPR